jgi:hypothetical protein
VCAIGPCNCTTVEAAAYTRSPLCNWPVLDGTKLFDCKAERGRSSWNAKHIAGQGAACCSRRYLHSLLLLLLLPLPPLLLLLPPLLLLLLLPLLLLLLPPPPLLLLLLQAQAQRMQLLRRSHCKEWLGTPRYVYGLRVT